MENMQLKALSSSSATGKNTPANDATAADTATDPQTGFQSLLQRLMGLKFAGDTPTTTAPDTAIAASEVKNDGAVETPAGGPGAVALPLLALPLAEPPPAHAVADPKLRHEEAGTTPVLSFRRAAGVDLDRLSSEEPGATDPHAGVEAIAGEKSWSRMREHELELQPGHAMDLHPGHTRETPPGHTLESPPGRQDAAVADRPLTHFAQGLQHAQVARALPATPPGIDTLINAPGWDIALAQKVVWLSDEKQHSAELHVNPPHLGPLNIKLSVDDNQTSAVFTSPHSAVREAIENALPRLREVLAESGITLGNASVTADSPRDGSAFDHSRQPPSPFTDAAASDAAAEPVATHIVPRGRGNGLVDLFA